MFAFENALDAILGVYTGGNRAVSEFVNSFVNSAHKIIAEAGCFDSVKVQRNAECHEQWQAALSSLDSVYAILQTLNSNKVAQDWWKDIL